MRRAIEKKFDVVLVDEFRTSKLCSCCHGELENYKIKNLIGFLSVVVVKVMV
jgi:transposase